MDKESAFQTGHEEGNKHCSNTYFYANAKNPMNKLREIKCLILHEDKDVLDICRT